MFILISDLTHVAQRGIFPQRLLASGTKYFLKNKNFCPETFWLMPQGVPRWGHATACTTRCPWKTSSYFQHFKVSKTRTPSCRRSTYPGEDFSPKDTHLGACHHFVKQICWHIDREAQPRPWCSSAYRTLAKNLERSGTSVHPDATCTSLRNAGSFASEVVQDWIQHFLPSSAQWLLWLLPLLHFHISLAVSTITFFLPHMFFQTH